MSSRRDALREVTRQSSTHAGLWLDKFLREQTTGDGQEGVGEKAWLIHQLEGLPCPGGYAEAFARRESGFTRPDYLKVPASTTGRMAVGLGEKGALEVGLRLEHTWGVPVIPGSALKGLASATAHRLLEGGEWRRREPGQTRTRVSFDALFGTTDDSGAVCFHDAWWIPEDKLPIHLDVMTVHHAAYYQHGSTDEPPPPADTDSPNPISFASVTGRYLIVVEGLEEWCDAAMSILKIGLRELGIGAKTNAGYGRLELDYFSAGERVERERQAASERAAADQQRQAEDARQLGTVLARIEKNNAAPLITEKLKTYVGCTRRTFATGAVKKLGRKWVAERAAQGQVWAVDLLAAESESNG